MRGAARAMGSRLIQISDAPEEVSDEVLRERVAYAEKLRKLVKTEEFAAFNADAVKEIASMKDNLVSMPANSFEGAEGMELKGEIKGYRKAFTRLRESIKLGDEAGKKLENRMAEANQK